jgi:hypothetical protein
MIGWLGDDIAIAYCLNPLTLFRVWAANIALKLEWIQLFEYTGH